MPLPSASAPSDGGLIIAILDIGQQCSLNLSKLPDGRYRATALTRDGRKWPTGYGHTPAAALTHLKEELT